MYIQLRYVPLNLSANTHEMVRLKHRYIIAQILPAVSVKYSAIHKFHPVTARDIQASLRSAIQELYGDIG